ncbi:MAG: hypothetical protein ISN29_01925 [Gammaproteobacteria bacterium AqS3]|nr:hypothetical protein [Gammaproteobacteria bacterium AqS3]
MGYSYGLNKNAELALNLRGVYVDERASFGRFSYADTQTRISTLDAELGHRFSPENETPGIYGRFGITLLENRAQEGEDFEALSGDFSASLALYRTYDPIVLRLSIAYRNTVGRQTTDGDYYDSGDTVTISPTVSFAVNHLISISAIGDVQVIQKNEINSRNIAGDYRRTIVRAGLGLSLSISDRTTLYASGSLVASGQDEASVGLFIRHRLRRQSVAGKIPKPDMGEIFNEPQPSQLPKN